MNNPIPRFDKIVLKLEISMVYTLHTSSAYFSMNWDILNPAKAKAL